MVERTYAHHLECLLESAGQDAVCMAWLRIAGRVVMHHHHCCSVVFQRYFDDFSGIDTGTVQGAAKQLLESNDTVFAVQQ
ncbi:hypothetical protein FQZ97_1228840 [compost metagenome]